MSYCHEICELLEIRGGASEPQDPLATGLVYTYASGLPRLVIANAVGFDHERGHGPSEGAQRPKKASIEAESHATKWFPRIPDRDGDA